MNDDDGVRATHCGLQQAVVLSEITQLSRATGLHPQVIPVGGVLLWAPAGKRGHGTSR